MSPEQKRKFNTAFGSVFFATGVVAWALTAYFAVTPNPPKPAPSYAGNVVDLQSCARTLRTLGYPEVSVQKEDVIAHEPLSTNPKEQLERATTAASVCRLEMKSFCIGESCPQPGLTIVSTRPATMRPAKAPSAQAKPASAVGAEERKASKGNTPAKLPASTADAK